MHHSHRAHFVTSGDSCSVVTPFAGKNRRVSGVGSDAGNVDQMSAGVTCFVNRADQSSDRAGSRDDISVLVGKGFSLGAPRGDAL